jgi:lysozyme
VVVATLMAVLGAVVTPGLLEPAGAASNGLYLGIDVAAHQHPGDKPIDWKAVRRSGVRFAFIKATEGAGRNNTASTNPWFGKDWDAAGAAGVQRGAYHYARPRYPLSTASSDAQRFTSRIAQSRRGELAPVLDLEETGGLGPKDLATWVGSWLKQTTRSTGRTPMIYTTRGFWTSYLGDTTRFNGYPLWMANHTTASRPVPLPGGWKAWTFWQYNDTGRVAGISAPVDLNWSCGWPGSAPSGSRTSPCTTTSPASSSAKGGLTTVTASRVSATTRATTPRNTTAKSSSKPSSSRASSKSSSSKRSTSSRSTAPRSVASKPAAAPAPAPAPPTTPPRSPRNLI